MEEFDQSTIPSQEPAAEAPKVSTLKEFAKLPKNKAALSLIMTASIFCFFSAAITAAAAFMTSLSILLDAAILLGLGLWLIITKSRVSAALLMAYAMFNVVYMLIAQGKFNGWLILLAGVSALAGTFKLAKDWKAYQEK